jgi:hypothetical protein
MSRKTRSSLDLQGRLGRPSEERIPKRLWKTFSLICCVGSFRHPSSWILKRRTPTYLNIHADPGFLAMDGWDGIAESLAVRGVLMCPSECRLLITFIVSVNLTLWIGTSEVSTGHQKRLLRFMNYKDEVSHIVVSRC